jgi:hypothetical protein
MFFTATQQKSEREYWRLALANGQEDRPNR